MENRLRILELALSQYGIFEFKGLKNNNPEIQKYFDIIGKTWVTDDETAWCSAYVNWICKTLDLPYSGELTARSWTNIGTETTTPKPGNLVLLSRPPEAWMGHIGIYIRKDSKYIWVLGGNQSNQVKISPYDKDRLIKYIAL